MIQGRKLVFTCTVAIGFALLIGILWLNRGYGEVSRKSYEFSMALYSACRSQSVERLNRIEELLDETGIDELPANERRWIEDIISKARHDQWEAAEGDARIMMQDQVKY